MEALRVAEAEQAEQPDRAEQAEQSELAEAGEAGEAGEVVLRRLRLRLVAEVEEVGAASAWVRAEAAVRVLTSAIDALADVDVGGLDVGARRRWLEGVECGRRMLEAASVRAAGEVDASNPFHGQGFYGARTAVTHVLQLSGPEAHRRLQVARMHDRLPGWREAAEAGSVGVAQSALMARVVANPRLDDADVFAAAGDLLDDARSLPYDEFERRLRTWEALADPVGDRTRNDRLQAARDVMLRPRPDGGWRLDGLLPDLDGGEFMEVWAWFVEAEWHTDWAEARSRLGDTATTADLARREPQRRADALVAMARAAATAPCGPRPSAVTVNVLIDLDTFEATLRGETRDPADYRTVVCRTQRGRRLNPDDAVNAALIGHIRRAVHDGSGTIIDLGRRSRLFRGAARDAALLLATTCAWIGCDRPVDWCDVDHSISWKAHGATVPRNGAPLCGPHNRHKEQGFQVHRDNQGDWHTIDPDGNEIT